MAHKTTIDKAFEDLIFPIDDLLNNPNIPLDDKLVIEEADKLFKQNLLIEPEIALQAYAHGINMGAYIAFYDDELMTFADKRFYSKRQSKIRKLSSGKITSQRWHSQAKKLAIEARQADPTLNQDDVSEYIFNKWPKKIKGKPKRMTVSTYKKYVIHLEKTGKLPKKKKA